MTVSKKMNPKWTETVTGKIVGATAIIAASTGLINGGMDLYKSILKIPDNSYDRINAELFSKHFNKTPIVSQPVQIKSSSLSIDMLLQVYDGGDVFVRYGDFQQWLPFKKPKIAAFSIFSTAFAQTPEDLAQPNLRESSIKWQRVEQLRIPPVIDIDLLSRSQPIVIDTDPVRIKALEDKRTWSKAFVISNVQQERAPFSPTTKSYEQIITADQGYIFTKVEVDLGSANKAKINATEIIDNGRAIRFQYQLTSGPLYDQYRGWIHATVKTDQEKIK
jgi:hypothetical protein